MSTDKCVDREMRKKGFVTVVALTALLTATTGCSGLRNADPITAADTNTVSEAQTAETTAPEVEATGEPEVVDDSGVLTFDVLWQRKLEEKKRREEIKRDATEN